MVWTENPLESLRTLFLKLGSPKICAHLSATKAAPTLLISFSTLLPVKVTISLPMSPALYFLIKFDSVFFLKWFSILFHYMWNILKLISPFFFKKWINLILLSKSNYIHETSSRCKYETTSPYKCYNILQYLINKKLFRY